MQTIKPIETVYKGYRFRSRLEARWAVFFDAMKFPFVYEPEGFDLGAHGFYLPDFWIPQVGLWAEVKPTEPSPEELMKCVALYQQTGKGVILLIGPPDFIEYDIIGEAYGEDESIAGVPNIWRCNHMLASEYFWDESRFFCMGYPSCPEEFGDDYIRAVLAARQARFEHGERGGKR